MAEFVVVRYVHTTYLEDVGEREAIEILRPQLQAKAELYVKEMPEEHILSEGRFEIVRPNVELPGPEYPQGMCAVRGTFKVEPAE
jgi:hypothetical protein